MNALKTIPDHNDVINVHEQEAEKQEAVGNDGIPSEVYKFASERLLTIGTQYSFLVVCLLVSCREPLCT